MTSRSSLKRTNRIKKTVDFNVVYRTGYRITGSFYSLNFLPSASGQSRIGITVPKRIGNAVVRNRVKRLVRERFRRAKNEFRECYDVVVTAQYYPSNHPRRADTDLARLFQCLKSFGRSSEKS